MIKVIWVGTEKSIRKARKDFADRIIEDIKVPRLSYDQSIKTKKERIAKLKKPEI